ncbi:MAG TPA: hypothetical protein VGE11_02050 [Pseudonocardia sp.]
MFVVPERTSWKLDEAVAGIARGLEILEVLRLDLDRQDAVAELLGSARQFPHVAGLPHTLVVACDVPLAPDAAEGTWRTEDRVAAVARHTSRRWFGHDSPPYEAVRYVVGPREAFALLELVGDPGLETRLQAKVAELAAACAVPFPIIEMLGAESPGYRARVALVEHPVHGRAVCKIFRPGAMASFRRELHARTLLADQPLTPQLLEHGPNWLLTPAYSDNGAHRLRRLPTFAEMYQLRPWATRALAEFAHTMHERGMFVLDLSPHNLMSDPTAGLKVVDLEFARPYTDFSCPPPSAAQAWSFRGVPAQLRAGADLPALALAKGVGNSVFHPAVAGLPVKRLLKAARKRDALRRVATQSSWYAAIATVGRLSMALRRGR